MDIRKRYINEKKVELRQQVHYKEQAENTLLDDSTSDFIRKNAEKKLDQANSKIKIIKDLLDPNGLDERINQELNKSKLKSSELKQDEKNKQISRLNEKSRKNDIRENYYGRLRKCSKKIRETRYQIRRTKRWLAKKEMYFPENKRKKLRNMPNNKGYIWYGIYYYGDKPANPRENIILFEQKGPILYIHEITPTYHKVYEKKTKTSPRILIENRIRKPIFVNKNSLINFIK